MQTNKIHKQRENEIGSNDEQEQMTNLKIIFI